MNVKKIIKLMILLLPLCITNIGILYSNNNNNLNINSIKIPKHKMFYSKYNNEMYMHYKNNIYIYNDLGIKEIVKIKDINNKKISSIISNDNILIVQTKNRELIGIDKNNYKLKWKKNMEGECFFTPMLSKNKLFIDRNGEILMALNNKNGEILWQHKVNMKNFFIYTDGVSLQTQNHLFYIYPDKKIITLKKKNGEKIDSHGICLEKNRSINKKRKLLFISDIKIYNNIIYVCYDNGSFLAINGLTGKVLFYECKKKYQYLDIYKKNIIIIKKNGVLICVDKFNGKKIWNNILFKNKKIIKLVTLNNKFIMLCDNFGFVYILKQDTGQLVNTFETKIKNIKHIYIKMSTEVIIVSNDKISKLTLKQ